MGTTGLQAVDLGRHLAIERLVHRYAWLVDHGEADKAAELFTDDGRLLGVGSDKIGRAVIADWGRQRAAMSERRSLHVHTNLLIEAIGDNEASGCSIVTVYRHDGEGPAPAVPLVVAEFADLYRKGSDGAWLFAERRLTVAFGSA